MNCPRCQVELKIKTLQERQRAIEIDTCPKCSGIWFDEGELDNLEKISEPVLLEIHELPSEWDQLTPLNCPRCEAHPMMKKADHPRDAQVIYDFCESCNGIWLDGGELRAIQQESWWDMIAALFRKLH